MAAIVTSAEQHPIKPSRRIQPMNTLKVADAVDQFAARKGESRRIQILRPFGVYSRNTYSAVVTPPIGPAYLASLLEAAGYPVGIIDAQGESIRRFTHSDTGRYKLQGLSTGEIIERISPDTAILGISLMFSQEWPEHRRRAEGPLLGASEEGEDGPGEFLLLRAEALIVALVLEDRPQEEPAVVALLP